KGLPPTGHRRAALPLPAGAHLRGRLGPVARRPGPARLPRLAGATARPAGRRAESDGPGAGRPASHPERAEPMNDVGIVLVRWAGEGSVGGSAGLGLPAVGAGAAAGGGAPVVLVALAAFGPLAVLALCPVALWWAGGTAAQPAGPAAPSKVGTEDDIGVS